MFRSALHVTKSDGKNGTVDGSPEIALKPYKEVVTGVHAAKWLASLLQGCSLLYPHGRLVVDLAYASSPSDELMSVIERHRTQLEARGGSLRVTSAPQPRFTG